MMSRVPNWIERRGDLLAQVFGADEGYFVWEVYRIVPNKYEPRHTFPDANDDAENRVKVGYGDASCLSLAHMRARSFLDRYKAEAD